jgi:hypothetical protein
MTKTIKGFKAFDKGLICKGFQYKEGETYEHTGAVKCCPDDTDVKQGKGGFHLCENPLDVLNYYNLCGSEFAEAEALGEIDKHDQDSKVATTKIKIGARLSLKGFVEASVSFLLDVCKGNLKDYSKLAASGDYSKLAASGNYSKLAASGDYSKLAASGNYSKLAASGDSSQLAASGYSSKLAASGDSSKLAASGDYSQLAASGYYSKLAASGDYSQLAASGDYSQLAASGHYGQLAASGYYSKLAASGDSSKLAASGHYSQLEMTGRNSVGAAIGIENKIKGVIGDWITLAEWKHDKKKDRWIPVHVASAQIDGKKLKADTWYELRGKKFVEVKL